MESLVGCIKALNILAVGFFIVIFFRGLGRPFCLSIYINIQNIEYIIEILHPTFKAECHMVGVTTFGEIYTDLWLICELLPRKYSPVDLFGKSSAYSSLESPLF